VERRIQIFAVEKMYSTRGKKQESEKTECLISPFLSFSPECLLSGTPGAKKAAEAAAAGHRRRRRRGASGAGCLAGSGAGAGDGAERHGSPGASIPRRAD